MKIKFKNLKNKIGIVKTKKMSFLKRLLLLLFTVSIPLVAISMNTSAYATGQNMHYNSDNEDQTTLGSVAEKKNNDPTTVNWNYSTVGGITTSGSLSTMGVVKKIHMRGLRGHLNGTMLSEIRFIDVNGNVIPWTIDWEQSIDPLLNFNNGLFGKAYHDKNVGPLSNLTENLEFYQNIVRLRTRKFIEKTLQDNRFSPFLNNQDFLDNKDKIYQKYHKSLKSWIDKNLDPYNPDDFAAIPFDHNVSGNASGIDLSFVLKTPAILDRMEFSMSYMVGTWSAVWDKKLDLRVISDLTVETASHDFFNTTVQDNNTINYYGWGQNTNNKFYDLPVVEWAKPFAITNPADYKASSNMSYQIYDKWKKISHNPEVLASDIRNLSVIGGKYDKYVRQWKKISSHDVSSMHRNISSSVDLGKNVVRELVSVDAPNGYVALLINEKKNHKASDNLLIENNNKVLPYKIPSIYDVDIERINYGYIYASPGDKVHIYYIKVGPTVQNLSMMNESMLMSEFENSYRDNYNDVDVITVPNDNVISFKNYDTNLQNITYNWSAKNMSNIFIRNFKIRNRYTTVFDWRKLNLPKTSDGENIFNLVIENRSQHSDWHHDWWGHWLSKRVVDLDREPVTKINKSINNSYNGKPPVAANIWLVAKNKFIINDKDSPQIFNIYNESDRIDDYLEMPPSFDSIFTPFSNVVNTNSNLRNLGNVKSITFDMTMPRGSSLSEIKINNLFNKSIPYTISEYGVYYNNDMSGVDKFNKVTDINALSIISNLWQDDDGTLQRILDSDIILNNGTLLADTLSKDSGISFGLYEKKQRIKFTLSLSKMFTINDIDFTFGLPDSNKNPVLNNATFKMENDEILEYNPNGYQALYESFYNYEGIPFPNIKTFSPKSSIHGPEEIYLRKTHAIFGTNKIQWVSPPKETIESDLRGLGKIKEGLISIHGNIGNNYHNIYSITLRDDENEPIEYEILHTYFLPGFDRNYSSSYNDGKEKYKSNNKYNNMYDLKKMSDNLQFNVNTSYPQMSFSGNNDDYSKLYDKIPIMTIHFRFKDKKGHRVRAIRTHSTGFNYAGSSKEFKIPRKIDVKLYDEDGNIFSSKNIIGKDHNLNNIPQNASSDIWLSSMYGVDSIKWSKSYASWGDKMGIDFPAYLKSNHINYDVYDELSNKWVPISEYKLLNDKPLEIRLSSRSNNAYAKYGILGLNYKGDHDVEDVKRKLVGFINKRSSHHEKWWMMKYSDDLENNPDKSLMYALYKFQDWNPVPISNKLLSDWIMSLKSPQLFTNKNIINLAYALFIVIPDADKNIGTGAIGDGSNNFYKRYSLPFIDADQDKFITFSPNYFFDKDIVLPKKPNYSDDDVTFTGSDLFGVLDITQFLSFFDYQTITVVVNPSKDAITYTNSNVYNLKNGDILKITISNKKGIRTFTLENGVKTPADDSTTFYINVKSLKPPETITGFGKGVSNSTFVATGKEGAVSITGIDSLLQLKEMYKNIDYYLILEDDNNNFYKKAKNPSLNDLPIFKNYTISILFEAKEGFVFENNSKNYESNPIYISTDNIVTINRHALPDAPDEIRFFMDNNQVKVIKNSISLFEDVSKNSIYELEIFVNPANSLIKTYDSNNINDFLANAKLFEGDIITFRIRLVKEDSYFLNNSKFIDFNYSVASLSNENNNVNNKSLSYTRNAFPKSLEYSGLEDKLQIKISKSDLERLVLQGYKLEFFLFRPSLHRPGTKAYEFIQKIKNQSYLKDTLDKKWKINTYSDGSYIDHETIDDPYSVPDFAFRNKIKRGDIVLLAISPNSKYDYSWKQGDISSKWIAVNDILTQSFTVTNIPKIATVDLPQINDNFVGYNGKTEIRKRINVNGEVRNKFDKGRIIPELESFLSNHPNIKVKGYLVSDFLSSYKRTFNNKPENTSVQQKNHPVIVQGWDSLGVYSSNHRSGEIKDLLEKFPSVKNGDYIAIRFIAINGYTFSNGLTEMQTSFYVEDLPYAIPKPLYPKVTNDSFYNGKNGSGYIYEDSFSIDEDNLDVTVTYNAISGAIKTFNSIEDAIDNLRNLANGDRIRLKITRKDNSWWGLNVKGVDYSDFDVDVSYTIRSLKTVSNLITPPQLLPFQNSDFSGTSGQMNYDLTDFIRRSNINTNNLTMKLFYYDEWGHLSLVEDVDLQNPISKNVLPFKNGGKIKAVFSPKKGYEFNLRDASNKYITLLKGPLFEFIKFPDSVLRIIFPNTDEANYDDEKVISFYGFDGMALPELKEIDSKYGEFRLAFKKQDGTYEFYDEDFNNFNNGDVVYVILYPNHNNNLWINYLKNANNPQDDFKVFERTVKLDYKKVSPLEIEDRINQLKALHPDDNLVSLTGNDYNATLSISDAVLNFASNNNIIFYVKYYNLSTNSWEFIEMSSNSIDLLGHIDLNQVHIVYGSNYPKNYRIHENYNSDINSRDYYDVAIESYSIEANFDIDYSQIDKLILIQTDSNYKYDNSLWRYGEDDLKMQVKFYSSKAYSWSTFLDDFNLKLFKNGIDVSDLISSGGFSFSLKYIGTSRSNPYWITQYQITMKVDKSIPILRNDIFKIEITPKSNEFTLINDINTQKPVNSLELDGIQFNYVKRAVPRHSKIDNLIFAKDGDISEEAILDLLAMNIESNDKYYFIFTIIDGVTGIKSTYENVSESNYILPKLKIGDVVTIYIEINNKYKYAFFNSLLNKYEYTYTLLENKTISEGDLKVLVILDEINLKSLDLSGGDGEGRISLTKISSTYTKIDLSIERNGKVIPYELETLRNGDVLIIKISPLLNGKIRYMGHEYTSSFEVRVDIRGLDTILHLPKLTDDNIRVNFRDDDNSLGIEPNWSKIFSDNDIVNNTTVSFSIIKNGVVIYSIPYTSTSEVINNGLLEAMVIDYNAIIKISVKANDGFTFTSIYGKSIELELLLDKPSPKYVKVFVPTTLKYLEWKDISGFAEIDVSQMNLDLLINNNIKFSFTVTKKDGSIEIYDQNTTQKYPLNLSNGDTVVYRVWVEKNTNGLYSKKLVINGSFKTSFSKKYVISNLYKKLTVAPNPNINDYYRIQGYNHFGNLYQIHNIENATFMFSITKKDGTTSETSTLLPTELTNGDIINITIIPNKGYGIWDDNTMSRINYNPHISLPVESLLNLLDISMPDNIIINYNESNGTYSIKYYDELAKNSDIHITYNGHDKLLESDIVPNKDLIIEIQSSDNKNVLSKDGDLTISKKYKIPPLVKAFNEIYDSKDVFYRNSQGGIGIRSSIFSSDLFDFWFSVAKSSKTNIDNWQHNIPLSIDEDEKLFVRVTSKHSTNVLIINSLINDIQILEPNLEKVRVVDISIPSELYFRGRNGEGQLVMTKEIMAILSSGLKTYFIIEDEEGNAFNIYQLPKNLKNDQRIKIVVQNTHALKMKDQASLSSKFINVKGLSNGVIDENFSWFTLSILGAVISGISISIYLWRRRLMTN